MRSGVRNECTPTFFDRFEEAFLHEARAFVAAVRGGAPTGLTLADAREATRIGIALRAGVRERASRWTLAGAAVESKALYI